MKEHLLWLEMSLDKNYNLRCEKQFKKMTYNSLAVNATSSVAFNGFSFLSLPCLFCKTHGYLYLGGVGYYFPLTQVPFKLNYIILLEKFRVSLRLSEVATFMVIHFSLRNTCLAAGELLSGYAKYFNEKNQFQSRIATSVLNEGHVRSGADPPTCDT